MDNRFLLTLILNAYFLLGTSLLQAQAYPYTKDTSYIVDEPYYTTINPLDLSEPDLQQINLIKQQYPNAEVRYITPQQAELLQTQGTIKQPHQVLTLNQTQQTNSTGSGSIDEQAQNINARCTTNEKIEKEEKPSPQEGLIGFETGLDGLDFLNTGSSDDAAVIIFVVIGIVISYILVAFTVKFIYNAISRDDLCFWWAINTHSNALLSSKDSGHFNGIKLSSGLVEDKVNVGITIDLGKFNADLELEDRSTHKVKGSYLMLGPSIRFYSYPDENAPYLALDLLVGSVDYEESNVLSYARAAYNFPFKNRFRVGVSVGSVYLDLDSDEGLVRKDTRFNLTGGVEVGYKF